MAEYALGQRGPNPRVSMEAIDRIRQQLSEHPVVLYMKGTPDRPMCRGSYEASSALNDCAADYLAVNVQDDPEIRAYLPKHSDYPFFPQLFIQGEFLGGSDITLELHEQGELARMIEAFRPLKASNA